MDLVDVIVRKRDGYPLAEKEIAAFVEGVAGGAVPDYQAAALLMAIVLRGMTPQETAWLTEAMVRSGDRIDLSDIPGVKVGKHSTGGVGDKVSIVLAPLAAACGVVVPKMSGRGLGHTGGTLDKLESIPGYRTDLSVEEFKGVLRAVGCSIIGQTARLAPADKKLYALRDVTGTVESIPLIAASIMSKKLAEGSTALVLDVKCGDGAFMKTLPSARALAAAMVDIGQRAGLRTEATITDMDAPLGHAVGNAVEIVECVETLKGNGPEALRRVVLHLASRMLGLAGVESGEAAARERARRTLESGHAADVFARMIERHGGDPRVVSDVGRLPATGDRDAVRAPRRGYVRGIKARAIGRAAHALGAGRAVLTDAIDPAVGITVRVKRGDEVREGDVLVELHHRRGRGLEEARALCRGAIEIGEAPPALQSPILDEVRRVPGP